MAEKEELITLAVGQIWVPENVPESSKIIIDKKFGLFLFIDLKDNEGSAIHWTSKAYFEYSVHHVGSKCYYIDKPDKWPPELGQALSYLNLEV